VALGYWLLAGLPRLLADRHHPPPSSTMMNRPSIRPTRRL
jgi:hypothetical protein